MPAALSVLVVADPETHGSGEALALADALSAAGYLVLGVRSGDASLPEAVQHLKPDVLVVRSDSAVRDVLEHIVIATRAERRPIVMFTDSADKPTMRQALGAGVSAYVVKGLKADRVQAVVDVAVERFAADEALRAQLLAAQDELDSRKLIDRAKRALATHKQLAEPEAHRFLQDLAMKRGLRLKDAAKQVLQAIELLG
jgi:two-component system, response regulator / RNA-binding antiterminator